MKERIDRRDLFRLGTAGLIGGGASLALGPRAFATFAPPSFTTGKKVLSIFLRGGNDSVNMVIPNGDPDYAMLRPNLGIPMGASLDLGNGFARAHPAMDALFDPAQTTSPWVLGNMALVHRTGYPNHSRSHFESQQNMETTRHFEPRFTQGFFARFAEVGGFNLIGTPSYNPVGAISVSLEQQMMFNGPPAVGHIKSVGAFALDPHMTTPQDYVKLQGLAPDKGLTGAYGLPAVAGNQWDELVRGTGTTLFDALSIVGALGPYVPAATWSPCPYPTDANQANCAGIPADNKTYNFFRQLRDSVQLLKETPCQSAGIELGGWDTHGNQLPLHAGQLAILSHALRTVYDDLLNDGSSILDDVVVVVESEFGRTSEENGSDGTDHGNAGVMIVMGGLVNGGVYNCDSASWTGNPLLDNGPPNGPHYLSVVTDYRKVWMEIFEKHFSISQPFRQDHIVWNYSTEVANPYAYLGLL